MVVYKNVKNGGQIGIDQESCEPFDPEKIENIYQRSSLIAQSFVEGNSLEVRKETF